MARKREVIKEHLNKDRSLPQKIAIDILGVLLIIAAGLFGWLPGPGGTPLLLAGLGLLATNHEWAHKLLHNIKEKGAQIMEVIFRDHPLIVIAYDILATIFIILSGVFLGKATGNIARGLATVLAFVGTGIFLGNRKRIYAINRFVNKKLHKKNHKLL